MLNFFRRQTPVLLKAPPVENKITDQLIIQKITKRERPPTEQIKIDAMKEFLDIIDPRDVDQMFISFFTKAAQMEYRLRGTPDEVLASLVKHAQ